MTSGNLQPSNQLVFGLREQIVEQIRKDVFAGRLSAGERLSEIRLGARFNVSRTPVREALQQLVQEGLLNAKPNHGVRVADEACDSVNELAVSIRRMIEGFALRSCYDQLDEEDFRCWEAILDRLANACGKRDYPEIANLDIEFHRAIMHRADIPVLNAIWTSNVAQIRSHFRATQKNYPDPMEVYAEHIAILKAFRAGPLDLAVKMLEENIT